MQLFVLITGESVGTIIVQEVREKHWKTTSVPRVRESAVVREWVHASVGFDPAHLRLCKVSAQRSAPRVF
jgi:hypothetical protein